MEYEIDVYGRLAEAMYNFIYASRTEGTITLHRDGKDLLLEGTYFVHTSTSHEEWCAELLSSIGLISPVTDSPCECAFRYNVAPHEAYEFTISKEQHSPPLSEWLAAFLYCQSDYGGGFRVYPKDCFPVSMELHELFLALTKAGYTLRKGLEFQWTEKATTSMIRAHLWPMTNDE